MPLGNELSGGRELASVRQEHPLLGILLERVVQAINKLGTNAAVSPTATNLPAPDPINSLQVKGTLAGNILTAPGEILHAVATHNSAITRGIQYSWEISANDPNFLNPHPIDTGASRSLFHHIPALDDGGTIVTYYLRATPQTHGSSPAKPTVFGTVLGPTGIQFTGATKMTLLTSQAAGTAFEGQGGQGLGKVQTRPSVAERGK